MSPPGKKFAYYRKLTAAQKQIYDKSDSVAQLKLPQASRFHIVISDLGKWLSNENKLEVQRAAQRLANGLSEVFEVPRVRIRLLAKRPSKDWGELHGLYEMTEGETPKITVWMRTAQRKQVVAFKTFLRTIIHEYMHHLDYALLELSDSFHTEGFYKRESKMVKDLMKTGTRNSGKRAMRPPPAGEGSMENI